MAHIFKRILNRVKRSLEKPRPKFDQTGERVDIIYHDDIPFEGLDLYEKSHFRRYQFALNIINAGSECGDFACGTGYGSIMLAHKARRVTGADINAEVIAAITRRYRGAKTVRFIALDLLDLDIREQLDTIVSFETIEHFSTENILRLLAKFNQGLRTGGTLIFSTPYLQPADEAALALGHHLTFDIDEAMIISWLSKSGFQLKYFMYQNYDTHVIEPALGQKDFIIGIAQKIT